MVEPPGTFPAAVCVRGGGIGDRGAFRQTRRNPATQSYGTKAGLPDGWARYVRRTARQTRGNPAAQSYGG